MAEEEHLECGLTLDKLKELGISHVIDGLDTHYHIMHRMSQYEVYFEDRDEETRWIMVILGRDFCEGFPKSGFGDLEKCDDHYAEFRMLYSIGRAIADHVVLTSGVQLACENNGDGDGEEISYNKPQFAAKVGSADVIRYVVAAVQRLHDEVSSERFIEQVKKSSSAFKAQLGAYKLEPK